MDLFLDFDYMLDCECKINYEALLQDLDLENSDLEFKYIVRKNNKKEYKVSISSNINNSTTQSYFYQVEIAPGIYKTIKIE